MKIWAAALLAACLSGGDSGWLRLKSQHLELLTDAGDHVGRRQLLRLEQLRQVLGPGRATPLPVRVLLFGEERDFRFFRPGSAVRGFYQSGPERDFIVLPVGAGDTSRRASHEYVHLVLNHTSTALPQWLEEGTAEFYSTLEPAGERLTVGLPVTSHISLLAKRKWMDANALAAFGKGSPAYGDPRASDIFYAQSWALTHMLNMHPAYRARMPDFVLALDRGAAPVEAFQSAFAKDIGPALDDLREYLARGRLPVAKVDWSPPVEQRIVAEPLTDLESGLAQVELLLLLDKRDEAARRIKALEAGHPQSAELQLALGLYLLTEKNYAAAAEKLRQAIHHGSASASFEYAMLLRDQNAPPEEVKRHLETAVARNPNHAEAQFLKGLMAAREGRYEDALGPLSQAVRVLPRQSYFWHALALCQHHLGNREQSRISAMRALRSATTPEKREMAEAALRLASGGAGSAGRGAGPPAVNTPAGWQMPQGDSQVEGVLEQIDCMGESARFHIRSRGQTVRLFVRKPGEVLLGNLSSLTFQFNCGRQTPRPVIVNYRSREDIVWKTTGDVTGILFPDKNP